MYLQSIGLKDTRRKCIDELLKLTNCNEDNNKPQQDMIIILDMHLEDIS